jgi:hypothetical protein
VIAEQTDLKEAIFYSSEGDLRDKLSATDYEKDANPKIVFAIMIDQYDIANDKYSFTLYFPSGRDGYNGVPSTNKNFDKSNA